MTATSWYSSNSSGDFKATLRVVVSPTLNESDLGMPWVCDLHAIWSLGLAFSDFAFFKHFF